MNKKGFTLIELLAVIVVLAVIATIAVPIVLRVVEKVRKGAAEVSAYGYINAIETQVATDNIKGIDHENRDDYVYDEINVKVNGKKPTSGLYTLQNGKIVTAEFCINGYIVSYNGDKARASDKCNGDDLKSNAELTLSKNHVSLSYPGDELVDVVENTNGGALSCESSDTDVATCAIENNKVKVISGKKEGSATITVYAEGNSRFKDGQAALLVTTEEGLLSITANDFSGVYDGNEHSISVTCEEATVKYGTTEGTYNLNTSPTYTEIGTYVVYYQVTKEGYKTVTGNKTVTIYAPPSCTLQVTTDGVSFASKSGTNLSGYGITKTSTAEYNNIDSMPLSTGTFHGYVIDADGNKESCSATITETVPTYTKYIGTCKANTYDTVTAQTTSTTYSWSILGDCFMKDVVCYSLNDVGNTGCTSVKTGQTRPSGAITEDYYANYHQTCVKTIGVGYWNSDITMLENQTSCEPTNFTCDASHVDQPSISCVATGENICLSGTKLNDSYCYTIN